MTDDTDTGDEASEHAVTLPLIDTFAALEAELAAKEDRIERLEAELADSYLEPVANDPDPVADPDPDPAANDPEMVADSEGPADEEEELPTHEDWEPETDPLEDTGAVDAEGEHEGVTAEPRGAASAASSAATEQSAAGANEGASTEPTDDAPAATADEPSADSGLQPVRTAGTPEGSPDESAAGSAAEPAEPTPPTEPADAEGKFGVTMETSSNLTGGSLGSSAGDGEGSTADQSSTEASTDDAESQPRPPDPTADRGERLSLLVRRAELRDEDAVVETFVRGIDSLDDVTREMLAHYREAGDAAPVDAHVAAGGSGERQYAYARNRTLRKAGVIEHDGAGRYRYALPALVEEAFDGHADGQTLADTVAAIEDAADLD